MQCFSFYYSFVYSAMIGEIMKHNIKVWGLDKQQQGRGERTILYLCPLAPIK